MGEFLKMMTNKILNKDPKDDMLKAYKLIEPDVETTGGITLKNLIRVAEETNQPLSVSELENVHTTRKTLAVTSFELHWEFSYACLQPFGLLRYCLSQGPKGELMYRYPSVAWAGDEA